MLLHAAVGGRSLWDAQWDAFAARHRVVRYDARGFGDSPLPGGPFSHVDDLCALLDHLGIERTAIVGNSLGGKTALEAALAHPDRVSALVLVSAGLGGHDPSADLEAFDEAEDDLLEAGNLAGAVELNVRMWLGAETDARTRRQVAAGQRRAFEVLLAALDEDLPPGPVRWLEDPPAAERLGEIRVPTLVVVGNEDVSDFKAIADRLAAAIPDARKEVLPGAAHLPGVERPQEFNRIVLEFLATV